MGKDRMCFVIGPIGEPGSETRKRSDQVLRYIIEPAVQPLGYETVRADKISEPGMITAQIIDRVVHSELVIADLSGRNPNVFYELAIRHAVKKPLIQIVALEEELPFDVRDMRTIPVDINDLDSVAEAKGELSSQIEAIQNGEFEMSTPVSTALELRALRDSGDPGQRALADVLEAIAQLRGLLMAQQERLSRLELAAMAERASRSVPGIGASTEVPAWLAELRREAVDGDALRRLQRRFGEDNQGDHRSAGNSES